MMQKVRQTGILYLIFSTFLLIILILGTKLFVETQKPVYLSELNDLSSKKYLFDGKYIRKGTLFIMCWIFFCFSCTYIMRSKSFFLIFGL